MSEAEAALQQKHKAIFKAMVEGTGPCGKGIFALAGCIVFWGALAVVGVAESRVARHPAVSWCAGGRFAIGREGTGSACTILLELTPPAKLWLSPPALSLAAK